MHIVIAIEKKEKGWQRSQIEWNVAPKRKQRKKIH
jgi:hypothetical protein